MKQVLLKDVKKGEVFQRKENSELKEQSRPLLPENLRCWL